MIAHLDTPPVSKGNIWSALAEPFPAGTKVTETAIRARLDDVVAGEYDVQLDVLPAVHCDAQLPTYALKCRLMVLGVVREHVGIGCDYKEASEDAFAAAASRFGIGQVLP